MTIYAVVPLLLLAAILQATIIPHLSLWGVFPDLPVVVVACWGLLRGAREGLVWGFVAGVAVDLLSGAPFGAATLSLMLVGTLSGLGATAVSRAFAVLPMVTVFLVTIVYDVVFLAIVQVTGGTVPWPDMLMRIVLLSAALNAILTPVVLWLMTKLNAVVGREEWSCDGLGYREQVMKIRIVVFRAVLVLAFAVLVAQLWRLQILEGDYYQDAADSNRFRLELNPGPRGVIYDRRGHLLARNMPQIRVSVIPAYLPEDEAERLALLSELAERLKIPLTNDVSDTLPEGLQKSAAESAPDSEPSILEILEQANLAPYRPAPLKTEVARDVALVLEEEHLDWPGVLVQVEPVREYLYSPLTSHIMGYIGPIPANRVDAYEEQGYDPNRHLVGITGVEYSFEEELRGIDGQKLVEVDVAGREVRTVGEPKVAIPGNNVTLTLDLDLQQATEEILKEHLKNLSKKQGVVVAMNPQTGEILSMVSLPSYDNNEFTGGISTDAFQALQDNPNRPLVNHAISGMFPPGSTYKIIVAAAGLEEQVVTADTRYHCGGILWLPNRFYPEDPSLAQPFYCWIHHDYHGSHGSLSIVSALGQSCDIYFYQLGGGYRDRIEGLGEERIGYYAELFGMGARSGIDLPGEAPGLVPSAKWKRVNYSESWVTGDTYNMAIGQGFVLATPLQVLNAAATVANGGTLYRPQIVRDVVASDGSQVQAFSPDVIRTVSVSDENIGLVAQGMRAVVNGSGATAWALKVPGVAIAGKTGTAEFFIDRNKDGLPDRDSEGNLPTHAWFLAYGPYANPEIALIVFVFGGGEGSGTAVPIASDILNYYFGRDRSEGEP